MKKLLSKNNLIFILILVTLFILMPTVSYAANLSINEVLKETVAGWYTMLRAFSAGFLVLLAFGIILRTIFTRGTSTLKVEQFRELGWEWIIMLCIILFFHYLMMGAIYLNETIVAAAEDLGQNLSGMEEGQELSLYEAALIKAYEVKFTSGTIGMILYIMFVYYTYKFVIVYFKRYINVIVLELMAPFVCCFSAYRKIILGKSTVLGKWIKEFIYNVFLQSLHALMYATVIGLSLKYSSETESFFGAILTVILFGVIFKVDKLVRKLFNMIGGSSTLVSTADERFIGKIGKTSKKAVGIIASSGGNIDINSLASQMLPSKDVLIAKANTIRTKAIAAVSPDELKKTWDETKKTINGEYKQVSSEELLRAEEELKNPKALRKAITAIPHTYKHTKEFIEKTTKDIKDKAEKIKLYLEAKKQQAIEYMDELEKETKILKYIPITIRGIGKLPASVKRLAKTSRDVYEQYMQALIDPEQTSAEAEKAVSEIISMSSGKITSSVLLAMGFEPLYRCPTIAMGMLAEKNYKDMVHLETPVESRKRIVGAKSTMQQQNFFFARYTNGCIRRLEKIAVSSFEQDFGEFKLIGKVAQGIRSKTITYRNVPAGTEEGVISWKGSIKTRQEAQNRMEILLSGLRGFRSDAQTAININLLTQLRCMSDGNQLSNLTPEMLIMLEQAGMIKRIEENGKTTGYIFLNDKIENAIINQKINTFLAENQDSLLAHKVNKFLGQHPDNEVARRITSFVIDNPESPLAQVLNSIVITEDGQIKQRVDSLVTDGEKINLALLGVEQNGLIVQQVLVGENEIVTQIIDKNGNIVEPAVDQNGEIIKFPVDENGMIIQNIVSPETGTIIQQVLSEDGIVKPIIFQTSDIVMSLENLNGVLTQITPENNGIIQVKNPETGEIEIFKPELGTMQIVKDEEGNMKLVVLESGQEEPRIILLPENANIQIVQPESTMMQVIDLEKNTFQTFVNMDNNPIEVPLIVQENGVIAQLEPTQGSIQIVNADGTVQEIKSDDASIVISKDENGILQIINKETNEVTNISPDAVVSIVQPENQIVQVVNLERNIMETSFGENARQVLTNLDIQLSPEELQAFTRREDIKQDLTAIAQGVAINLGTGEVESVVGITGQTNVFNSLLEEVVTPNTVLSSEENSFSRLNSLLGEIQAIPSLGEQAVDSENMTNLLLQEMEAYVLETARTTGTTDTASMVFSYEDGQNVLNNLQATMTGLGSTTSIVGSGLENEVADLMSETIKNKFDITSELTKKTVLEQTIAAYQAGEITGATDMASYWNTDAMDKLISTMNITNTTDTFETVDTSVVKLDDLEYTLRTSKEQIEFSKISQISDIKGTETNTQALLNVLTQKVVTATTTEQKQNALEMVAATVTQKSEDEVLADNKNAQEMLASIISEVRSEVKVTNTAADVVESRMDSLEVAVSGSVVSEEVRSREEKTVQATLTEIIREVQAGDPVVEEFSPTQTLLDAITQLKEAAKSNVTPEYAVLEEESLSRSKVRKSNKALKMENKKTSGSKDNKIEAEKVKVVVRGPVGKAVDGKVEVEVPIGVDKWFVISQAGNLTQEADREEIARKNILAGKVSKETREIIIPKIDITKTETIKCEIKGCVISCGEISLNKGATIQTLIRLAGGLSEGADVNGIRINNAKPEYGIDTILRGGDVVFVPKLSEEKIDEEKDKARGLESYEIDAIIKKVCIELSQRPIDPISLKRIKDNEKTRIFVVNYLKMEINKQKNIILEDDEIQRRLLKFVNNELRKNVASAQVNNMTIVRSEEVPESTDMVVMVDRLLAEQARTRLVTVTSQKAGAKVNAQETIRIDMENFLNALKS